MSKGKLHEVNHSGLKPAMETNGGPHQDSHQYHHVEEYINGLDKGETEHAMHHSAHNLIHVHGSGENPNHEDGSAEVEGNNIEDFEKAKNNPDHQV